MTDDGVFRTGIYRPAPARRAEIAKRIAIIGSF
jgi:hypothetical protein